MRILLVTPWYPRGEDGAGSFVEDQVRAVADGNDIAVLHLRPRSGRPGLTEEDREGVRVMRWSSPTSQIPLISVAGDAAGVVAGLSLLRLHGFAPQIVHAHVYAAVLAAMPAARVLGVPLLVSEHYSGLIRGRLSRRARAAARWTFTHAALTCPVSESLREGLARLAPSARFRVVPNPVDTRAFAFAKRRQPASDARHRLLAVGSFVPVKGMTYLVEAMGLLAARRRDFQLELIGDGPERSVCERRVGELGLSDLIMLPGRQPRADVADAMRRADLMVAPSEWETFSCAVAEALCSGVPVLATAVGALPELVQDGRGRLVPPGDPRALANALDEMLDALHGYDRAAVARGAVRQFSADAVGKTWREIYSGLLSGASSARESPGRGPSSSGQ